MTLFPENVALALYAVLVAGIVGLLAAQAARGGIARRISASWRNLRLELRVALLAGLIGGAAIGGSKTNSPPMRATGGVVSSPGQAIRQVQGVDPPPFALAEVRTGGVNIAAPSTNAVVSQSLLRRGASEGGEWLELDEPVLLGTSSFTRVYASPAVLSFGTMRHPAQSAALPDGGATNLVALRAPLGVAPEANWGRLSAPSRFWHGATPGGNIFTWENALLGRQDDAPATIQVETTPDGGFTCRYDFSQASPTNDFVIGAQVGAAAVEALSVRGGVTNGAAVFRVDGEVVTQGVAVASIFANSPRFELVWRNAAGLGDLSGDTDGDGLLDGDEIMLYGTDPRESDTDGDGMSDYAEVAQGLNPHSPDSDGDGVPDGWTADGIATNRLFSCEGDTIAATLHLCGDVATNDNAVLLVGDLPLLLSSARTWDLFIPRGEQFNLRLSYGGAVKPELALEAGPGIWIEGAQDIFAETAPMGGLRLNSRDGVASQMRAAPARGGYGGHAMPSISGIRMEFDQCQHLLHREASSTVTLMVTPSGRVSAGDVAYEFMTTGVLRHEPVRAVSPESDWVWSILHPYSPIDCGKGFSLRAKIYDTQGQEVLTESSFTRCPLRNGISTRLVGGSETDGFSPHLGEALAVGVPAYCACPLQVSQNMLYGFDVEVEAAREPNMDTHAGRQHLAWFDGDEDRSGVQRRIEIEDDRLGVPFIWDGVATSGAAEIQAAETFDTGSAQYHRILPQVVSGEPVPPPYIDAIVRVFEHGENSEMEGEWIVRVYVPQVAKVTWDTSIVSALQNDIYATDWVTETNIFLMAGISATYAGELMEGLPGAIAGRLPLMTNIRIVGESETVTGRYKEIKIVDRYASKPSRLGDSPNESCSFMNAKPQGDCYVYFPAFTNGLRIAYESWISDSPRGKYPERNDWSDIAIPFSLASIPQFLAEVAVHELCHTLGLVSEQYLGGVKNGHNDCEDGCHVMDVGEYVYWPMRFQSTSIFFNFKNLNSLYLNFILPGGNR